MTYLPALAPMAGARPSRRRTWPTKTTPTAAAVRVPGFATRARYPIEGANV